MQDDRKIRLMEISKYYNFIAEAVLKTHQLTLFQKLETAESPKVTHTWDQELLPTLSKDMFLFSHVLRQHANS